MKEKRLWTEAFVPKITAASVSTFGTGVYVTTPASSVYDSDMFDVAHAELSRLSPQSSTFQVALVYGGGTATVFTCVCRCGCCLPVPTM